MLISADSIFADIFGRFFKCIEDLLTTKAIINLIGRLIIIVIIMIYLLCIVYNITNKKSSYNYSRQLKDIFKISIEETIINTVLTIINIVYLIFSGIQVFYVISYFIGNSKLDFNLASYARQGFFQLMFITFINLILILISSLNKKEEKKHIYTKVMNLLMCVFTIIIVISAVMRMYLYEREYGYTFLRLMVYFILITELVMMVPTIIYIIKEKGYLLKSYFIIGTVMYVLVNFLNIDYLIAKNNVDRALKLTGVIVRDIDISYLINNLGCDATSEILRLYENIEDKDDKKRLNNYLYKQYKKTEKDNGWQAFNLSKQHTKDLLKDLNLKYQEVNNNKYYNRYNEYKSI